jgi:hypothetical protein
MLGSASAAESGSYQGLKSGLLLNVVTLTSCGQWLQPATLLLAQQHYPVGTGLTPLHSTAASTHASRQRRLSSLGSGLVRPAHSGQPASQHATRS